MGGTQAPVFPLFLSAASISSSSRGSGGHIESHLATFIHPFLYIFITQYIFQSLIYFISSSSRAEWPNRVTSIHKTFALWTLPYVLISFLFAKEKIPPSHEFSNVIPLIPPMSNTCFFFCVQLLLYYTYILPLKLYWFCSYTCIYAYKYILTFVFVVGVCLYFPSGHGRLSLLSPQLQYINRRPPQPAGHRGMQQPACLRQGDPASAFKAIDLSRLQDWRTASPIPRPQKTDIKPNKSYWADNTRTAGLKPFQLE